MCKARANENRKTLTFNLGDLVSLHLRKEMLRSRRENKPMPRGAVADMGVSSTFNVINLTPYLENDGDLRENIN